MRSFVILLISAVCFVSGRDMTKEIELLKKCSKDEGKDIVRIAMAFKDHKLPENDADYCVFACILKETGFIADGKFNSEKALEENKKVYAPESVEKANEIEKGCINQIGTTVTDECDFTKKYFTCVLSESASAGLKTIEPQP